MKRAGGGRGVRWRGPHLGAEALDRAWGRRRGGGVGLGLPPDDASDSQPLGRFGEAPVVLFAALLLVLVVLAGRGVTSVFRGSLVHARNKMSLSRL